MDTETVNVDFITFNTLILSAAEIQQLTGWPDAMVQDYLNLLRSLIALAGNIDQGAAIVRRNTQSEALHLGAIGKLQASVAKTQNSLNALAQLATDIARLRAKIHSQAKDTIRVEQLATDIAKLRAKTNLQAQAIKRAEQMAVGW